MKLEKGWLLCLFIGLANIILGQDMVQIDSMQLPELDTMRFKIDLLNTRAVASSSYKVHSLVDQTEGRKILNWDKVLEVSNENNNLFSDYYSDLIKVSYFKERMSFGLGVGIGSESNIQIPYSSISGALEGNAPYLNQEIYLGFEAYHNSWNEINLNFSYAINDLKPWITLSVVDGYQNLNFDGGYTIFTPESLESINVDRALTIDSYDMLEYIHSDSIELHFNSPFHNFFQFKNIGWMVDLGVDFKFQNHNVSIFVEDVNQISWKGNQYSAEGQGVFSGIDISNSLGESIEFETRDTLDNILGINTNSNRNYNTKISTKFGFNYQYSIQENIDIGIRGKYYYHSNYEYYFAQLKLGYQITDWLYGALFYTLDPYSYNNVGVGFELTFPHYNFHLRTHSLASLISPYDFNRVGLNFGMSLKF